VIGVEVAGGEVDDGDRLEQLAGVEVDTEEQQRFFPGVEMSAGRFPVDPPGPSVAIRSVGDSSGEGAHPAHMGELMQVLPDVEGVDRRVRCAFDDEALTGNCGREVPPHGQLSVGFVN
jgi:hypothetical protein